MKAPTTTNGRSPWTVTALWMAVTLASCADDARPCLAYACNTSVLISHELLRERRTGAFDVRLCHGEICDEWTQTADETQTTCDDAGPSGLCIEPTDAGLVFHATWTFNEGVPREKTFGLSIVDGESGAVLLDETREAEFVRSALFDHCHDCWAANIEIDGP